MKRLFLALICTAVCILPALGQDSPVLTPTGLEEFQVGKTAPSKSAFPGLTTKKVEVVEWEEGEKYENTYLKFFLNGRYLGKAFLVDGKVIREITIVDSAVRYEGGFAVGSTWDEVQRVFPRVELNYTYISEGIYASSEAVPGLQVRFSPADYVGSGPLVGEWKKLNESDLKASSKATMLRLFSTGK